jgi:hypothetical protein
MSRCSAVFSFVIPAKAGIQLFVSARWLKLDARLRGHDTKALA